MASKHTSTDPRGILSRVERERAFWAGIIEIGMARPSSTRRPVVYVVVLLGIQGQVDIRAFVLQDVLEPAPGCAASPVLGPDESFRCLDFV